MRTLVTGGAGFIGSNIVALLVGEGHEVTVIDNMLSGYRSNLDGLGGVRLIEGDIRDASNIETAADGAEVIFHLAASVGNKRSIEMPVDDADINVIGTLRVLEAARKYGTRKIVFSSSAGIFGELETLPIAETHPLEPDSPYGATKLCAEKLCLAYGRLYGFEAVALRYFNVYGVNQRYDAYGNVIPIFANRLVRNERLTVFSDGEQTRDFVNVKDVARANYNAALADGVSGAYNVASGTRITINELTRLMGEAAGIEPVVEYTPPRPGDVRDSLADISRAAEAFGYRPVVGLAEGLGEYMDWVKTLPE